MPPSKKWRAKEALREGVIDGLVPASATKDDVPQMLLDQAEALVSTSEKGNLSQIKLELYQEAYDVLLANSRAKL